MIYITGDCHADFRRFNTDIFPEQNEMTKEDYVIICGDFGGVWDKDKESSREKRWLNWLEAKPYTTLFVCGNHENFDRLYDYPVEEWHGGKVHKIRDSVIHLMRGQVFEIDGKKIFTFGGARSHDISGGILELDNPNFRAKKKRLDQGYEPYRINHLTWWEREMPSQEEMDEGRRSLEENDYTVDFIVSHCAASSTAALISHLIKEMKTKKQIILVSHNATIPMLGDAQNIILCRNENDKIKICSRPLEGSLDKKTMVDYIAEITDGGKSSIKKRVKKYNLKSFKED